MDAPKAKIVAPPKTARSFDHVKMQENSLKVIHLFSVPTIFFKGVRFYKCVNSNAAILQMVG